MSDELSAALRELAAGQATAPVVDGAGIRARAMRRRRRRRTAVTLGAGTVALAVLGFALHLDLGAGPDHPPGNRIPPATQSTSSPPPTATPSSASATLDLRRHSLTVDGRVLRVLSDLDGRTGFAGPLTVRAKHASLVLGVELASKGPVKLKVPYVVELRDTRDQPLYVGALVEPPGLGTLDTTGDWIGLEAKDAVWFQARVRAGDAVAVTTVTRPSPTPTETSTGAEPSVSAPDELSSSAPEEPSS